MIEEFHRAWLIVMPMAFIGAGLVRYHQLTDNAHMKVFFGRRILSVCEASDEVGRSCASLFAKPGAVGERSEIEVRIGEQHGSFYRLHPEWLAPLLRWVQR